MANPDEGDYLEKYFLDRYEAVAQARAFAALQDMAT